MRMVERAGRIPVLSEALGALYRELATVLPGHTLLARVPIGELGGKGRAILDIVVLRRDMTPELVVLLDPPARLRAGVERALGSLPLLVVDGRDLARDPVKALHAPLVRILENAPDAEDLTHPSQFLGRGAEHPSTGLTELDRKLGPLSPGEVIVVGGLTGVGKSAFLRHLAIENAVRRSIPTLYISLESSLEQIAMAIVATRSRVSSRRLYARGLTDEEEARVKESTGDLVKAPLTIVAKPDVGPAYLEALLRCHTGDARPVRMALLDYLELVRTDDPDGLLPGLKRLARRHRLPLVVATNRLVPSRLVRPDGVPALIDLGTLGPHADKVLLCHRERVYEMRSDHAYIAEVSIAKNRSGPTGMVQVAFFEENQRYQDLEVTYDQPVSS